MKTHTALGLVVLTLAAWPLAAQQPAAPPGGKDHVAAVKQSLAQSVAALKQYQWIETTVVSIKGEEKSRTQNTCFYGADGQVQKTPVVAAQASEGKQKRGLRGKIVENKKEEISESVKEAIALVKQYIPPDAGRIQAAKDTGKLSVVPPDKQGKVQVVIKDYLKAGDSLTIDVDTPADRILGVTVATFTDSAKDAVGLKVVFGAFTDGTVYPGTVNLDVKAQNLAVAIENSGYKKLGS